MRKKSLLLWIPALCLLAAVLWYVNRPETRIAVSGAAVGELPADFSVVCTDGSVFTLSEHRGQTVVINLWATWCAPCVRELPAFDRLQRERPGSVYVLALHADPVTEDAAAFFSGLSLSIPCATADKALTAALGGGQVLPQTVVIGPDGTVTYNSPGALSYEALSALVNP